VARLRLYLDEDVPVAIADGLRLQGVDAWTARDAGMLGADDREQLAYAVTKGAAIFSHDDDMLRIASEMHRRGDSHAGVVFAPRRKHRIGECIRRLERLARRLSAEEMRNRIEFL
jgi:hypothetical protein